ncbi:DAR GTPase 2, mitochondrial [Sesamum alatum]|uniref:DAR GTPase 2, mitochondrial n=1 Tax=Sesamum alatum TaxID=300844 RepID=A0AAE2CBP6_9LAMI|nr:DAR GTPase 2, mitochondrial [Sesamum alatum]
MANLPRRSHAVDNFCPVCKALEEDLHHLILSCPLSQQVVVEYMAFKTSLAPREMKAELLAQQMRWNLVSRRVGHMLSLRLIISKLQSDAQIDSFMLLQFQPKDYYLCGTQFGPNRSWDEEDILVFFRVEEETVAFSQLPLINKSVKKLNSYSCGYLVQRPMAAAETLIQKIGKAVKEVAKTRSSEWWYTPHMAAASRAIDERIPFVDLVLEVRDARIPLSSEYLQLRKFPSSSRHVVVLNKMDLANRPRTKEWLRFFEEQKCMAFGVNSHNKENIREFLTFLQGRVRELNKKDDTAHAITLMLVGIPNVGKSALANSLHQVGRIAAAEKGKLKHSVVSPQPGETQSISSLKIASHPNIYVLDTPGVLPPNVIDDGICSKLALTGSIKDSAVGEIELAEYFLSILSMSDEYKKWGALPRFETQQVLSNAGISNPDKRQKRQYPSDHTQDFIVNNVRRTLFDTVSSFTGCIENGKDLARLIEQEFEVLLKVFHLPLESEECSYSRAATKLLNLYRTGRLGHYTLDSLPSNDPTLSPLL